jgi:multiple sugar transport system substrate-binding protein
MKPLLLLGAILALAAGCQPPEERRVTLRVANWGGAGEEGVFTDTIRRVNQEFERANPGVKVQVEGIPGEYVQKMLLNHVAGSMPDVMILDASSAAVFMNNGILADLTPHVRKEPPGFIEQYWPNVTGVFRRGEKLYGIPNDFTPMAMYYNKALFDAKGVPYPKPGWTWEEFRDTARKLSDPQKKQYGFVVSTWMPGWVMWLWNGGGEVLGPDGKASGTLDSAINVATLNFLKSLVDDGIAPSLSQTAAMGADPFEQGRAAMTVSGHWSIVGFKNAKNLDWKKLGVTELPARASTPSRTVLYMSAYGIPAKAKHPDLAWEYIKLWTSAEIQRQYNSTGIAVCGRIDIARARSQEGEIERQFLPIIPQGRAPLGSQIEGYERVEAAGRSAMDAVLNGTPAQNALSRAAATIDQEIKKRVK